MNKENNNSGYKMANIKNLNLLNPGRIKVCLPQTQILFIISHRVACQKNIKEPNMKPTKLVGHELKDRTFNNKKNITRTAHC